MISIDDFSPANTSKISERNVFILTSCDETLAKLLESDFLSKLNHSESWQLILSNLTFGYIRYTAITNTHLWNPHIHPYLLNTLQSTGKIIVLHPAVPVDIPALSNEDKTVTMTCFLNNLTTQWFKLDTRNKDGEHAGECLKFGRKGSEVTSELEFGPELTERFRTIRTEETERIARKLETDPTFQFELNINSSDKLLDLWYMKFLRERFNLKTHVSKEYEDFVKNFYPQLQDCISSQNSDGQSRFHYDCCQLSSNEDCVPGKEWALEFEVEVLNIGPSDDNDTEEPSSNQITFFHDKM